MNTLHLNIFHFFRRFTYRILYDGTLIRASALTYQTLIALVPLLAIMVAIAKGFGIEMALEETLRHEFKDQQEVLQHLLAFSKNTLDQLQGGLLAAIGIGALFYTVTRLFTSVEEALNAMWGIIERKTFLRTISSHITLILMGPLLFTFSSGITIFISTHAQAESPDGLLAQHLKMYSEQLLVTIPYLTITLLFTIFLYTLPNRRPLWYEALVAACFAALAFQVLQATYIRLQLEMTKISAIWGSFVALPLFLVWLWSSWAIFLSGGELAVAIHDRLWKNDLLDISVEMPVTKLAFQKAILEICQRTIQEHLRCPTIDQLCQELEITQRSLNPLLIELEQIGAVKIAYGDSSRTCTVAPLTTKLPIEREKVEPTSQLTKRFRRDIIACLQKI